MIQARPPKKPRTVEDARLMDSETGFGPKAEETGKRSVD